MNCPICKAKAVTRVIKRYDDRYGYPGQFPLMRCVHCGHAFLDCVLTPSQLTTLYNNYYPRKSLGIESYKPHVERGGFSAWFDGLKSSAFRWVPKNVRVLDIGCGFGQSLGYHSGRGCDVYGVEADENIRRVVDRFGFRVHVGLFAGGNYEAKWFDYITMDQVIEHVSEPLTTLQGVARILKSGGTVVLSTPNANGWGAKVFGKFWINWHTPYHLQCFSKRSLLLAAEQAGLVLEDVKTITSAEWLYYQWIHLLLYPKVGVPSVFWTPNQQKTLIQKLALKALWVIHKTKLNHLLTRGFDATGHGDNLIVVLKKP